MLCCRVGRTGSQAPLGQGVQVHKLLALGAPHALVLEGPQSALEALLIVTRYRHPTEPQALAHLRVSCSRCDSHTLLCESMSTYNCIIHMIISFAIQAVAYPGN